MRVGAAGSGTVLAAAAGQSCLGQCQGRSRGHCDTAKPLRWGSAATEAADAEGSCLLRNSRRRRGCMSGNDDAATSHLSYAALLFCRGAAPPGIWFICVLYRACRDHRVLSNHQMTHAVSGDLRVAGFLHPWGSGAAATSAIDRATSISRSSGSLCLNDGRTAADSSKAATQPRQGGYDLQEFVPGLLTEPE